MNIISYILKEARWIKSNNDIEQIKTDLVEIKNDVIDESKDFYKELKIELEQRFSQVARELKSVMRQAIKGNRKGLLVFVPDASRKIFSIKDTFVQYIVRAIYDNYHDMTKGILFRIHMNELFRGDIVFDIVKNMNETIKGLQIKKDDVKNKFKKLWHELAGLRYKFENSRFAISQRNDNVFANKTLSKPFYDKIKEFKLQVKNEHPRVQDEKLNKFILNNYSYKEKYEKIKKDFLETIPEYIEYEKSIKNHFEDERKEKKQIQDIIDKELEKLDFKKIKNYVEKMINAFIETISSQIVKGSLK